MSKQGVFIVIDGSDGSGKSTQYARLCDRFKAEKIAFETIKFPRYGQPSAYFIEQYLQGKYGQVDEVPARRASVFYALDRYEARGHIQEQLKHGVAIVADRYVASNMGHQGAKMPNSNVRREFFEWLDDFEYNLMDVPRPDINIVLSVSDGQAARNIAKRAAESDHASDIHEANPDFLRRSAEVYREICELFPDQYHRIDCMRNANEMLAANIIHNRIWTLVNAELQKGTATTR